ncbi:MAG: hypothetical protein ACT4N2_14330 [Hyphomicrobium sp.]
MLTWFVSCGAVVPTVIDGPACGQAGGADPDITEHFETLTPLTEGLTNLANLSDLMLARLVKMLLSISLADPGGEHPSL